MSLKVMGDDSGLARRAAEVRVTSAVRVRENQSTYISPFRRLSSAFHSCLMYVPRALVPVDSDKEVRDLHSLTPDVMA